MDRVRNYKLCICTYFLSFSFSLRNFFFLGGLGDGGGWEGGRVAMVVEGKLTIYQNTLHMLLYLVISYSFLDRIFPGVLKHEGNVNQYCQRVSR